MSSVNDTGIIDPARVGLIFSGLLPTVLHVILLFYGCIYNYVFLIIT